MSAFCYSCRAELGDYQGYMTSYCATCQSRIALEKQMKENAENLAEQQAEQTSRNLRMQEEMHNQSMQVANQNAALARKQARENAKLAAEAGVSYDDAYQYGLHFKETAELGWGQFDTYLTEDGKLVIKRTRFTPYTMAHLNQAFDRGFKESIQDLKDPGLKFMKNRAYEAGESLKEFFSINSGIKIGDTEVYNLYNSKIERVVDTTTGLVQYVWDNPFETDALNESFSNGVNAGVNKLNENTPEAVAARMETEVVEILAERAEKARVAAELAETKRINNEAWAASNERVRKNMELFEKKADVLVIAVILLIVLVVMALWVTNHGIIATLVAGLSGWAAILGAFHDLHENILISLVTSENKP